ncbi:hypothetical protein [Hyalangium versicolor]|uniref:hypothetical protein n=1 Tax=Hyalangium versicolor TaxID=2861190 RepID=UPI001CC97317|nr:hypothetical protein [Hyalangium versicolor]
MTKRLEEFDFEAACRALGSVSESSPAESREAVELAAYALQFLYVTDQLPSFREYLRDIKEPATREAHVEHVFDDMPHAVEWLKESAPAPGVYVKVGERTYEVWRASDGKLLLVPHVSSADLDSDS